MQPPFWSFCGEAATEDEEQGMSCKGMIATPNSASGGIVACAKIILYHLHRYLKY